MKIELKDLKKAVKWFDENTNTSFLSIQILSNYIELSALDKQGAEVRIMVYQDSTMMTKIQKTDIL